MRQDFELRVTRHQDWNQAWTKLGACKPGSYEYCINAGRIVEVFNLVGLGVEWQMFDKHEAEVLFTEYRQQMVVMLELASPHLESIVDPMAYRTFHKAANGSTAFETRPTQPSQDRIRIYLRAALATARRAAEDEAAKFFQIVLLFDNEERWVRYIEQPISFPSFLDRLTNHKSVESETIESLLAGFVRTIEDMARWRALFQAMRLDKQLDFAVRPDLVRRLALSTGWRIQIQELYILTRIENVGELCGQLFKLKLCSEFGQLSTSIDTAFSDYVRQLILDWKSDHPRFENYLTNTAGA